MTKKSLNENTVRRFMKLADIGNYSGDFVDKLKEQDQEIGSEEEISEEFRSEDGALPGSESEELTEELPEELPEEPLEEPLEAEEGGEEEVAEITDEDLSTLRDAKDVLEKILATAPGEEETLEEPMDEPMDEPFDGPPPEEEEEAGMRDGMYENLIKKVSSKIAERVLAEQTKTPLDSIDVDALTDRVIARILKEKK